MLAIRLVVEWLGADGAARREIENSDVISSHKKMQIAVRSARCCELRRTSTFRALFGNHITSGGPK